MRLASSRVRLVFGISEATETKTTRNRAPLAAAGVFDNIPLTALALRQGGYDWALLAYAVGFGGSMVWFGSSAGVALIGQFPEARSLLAWMRGGWHVAFAYLIGFFVMLALRGWCPEVGG
jgi:hypothetical protein